MRAALRRRTARSLRGQHRRPREPRRQDRPQAVPPAVTAFGLRCQRLGNEYCKVQLRPSSSVCNISDVLVELPSAR